MKRRRGFWMKCWTGSWSRWPTSRSGNSSMRAPRSSARWGSLSTWALDGFLGHSRLRWKFTRDLGRPCLTRSFCTRWRVSDVEGRLDVGGAVAIEAGGGDGLREDDADRNEDGAGPGGEGHGDFDPRTFGILIAAAEAEAALGQILTDGDLLLKAAAANASEDAGLDASAVAARNDAVFDGAARRTVLWIADFGLGFNPDGGRVAKAAVTRDAFADFEGFQLQLVEIDDFAALAEAAFHEETREGFLG